MTPADYRASIAALGLTQVGAAELLGVNPRTSRRWALGEAEVPRTVEVALRAMLKASPKQRNKIAEKVIDA